jgi:hypothetical protein
MKGDTGMFSGEEIRIRITIRIRRGSERLGQMEWDLSVRQILTCGVPNG